MKTLDDVLSERAQTMFQEQLIDVVDPTTWTTANRDEKMSQMRSLSEQVADQASEFVKEMLETEIEGKSLITWKVLEQFIGAELQLLMAHRDDLDAAPDESLPDFAVSYDWVTTEIRKRVMELTQLGMVLAEATRPEGSAEAI